MPSTRYLDPDVPIPRRLPGEPQRDSPPRRRFIRLIIRRVCLLTALGLLTLPLWIPYLLGVALAGWPPNVPRLSQVAVYLGLIWRRDKPPPGLPTLDRLALTCAVVRQTLTIPVWGLAWFVDALLFGRALAAVRIRAPLFHISGARSGSTQLSRYLETDPELIAPSVLQIMFPYLWLWRIVVPVARRFFDVDRIQTRAAARLPPEFRERHEDDFYRTDTFEMAFCAAHLNRLARYLGPDAIVEEFSMAQTSPGTARLWTETFVDYLDGVARKTLLFAGLVRLGPLLRLDRADPADALAVEREVGHPLPAPSLRGHQRCLPAGARRSSRRWPRARSAAGSRSAGAGWPLVSRAGRGGGG